jgi:hypothetical protein
MFTDKVWATGCTHTKAYIKIKKDRSENKFGHEFAIQKRSKASAWMFWGATLQG